MGKVLYEIAKQKADTMYVLAGIAADVAQLARAYYRNEKKGARQNISQIIRKLEKIKGQI